MTPPVRALIATHLDAAALGKEPLHATLLSCTQGADVPVIADAGVQVTKWARSAFRAGPWSVW